MQTRLKNEEIDLLISVVINTSCNLLEKANQLFSKKYGEIFELDDWTCDEISKVIEMCEDCGLWVNISNGEYIRDSFFCNRCLKDFRFKKYKINTC